MLQKPIKILIIIVLFLCFSNVVSLTYAHEVSFTQDDRNRIIRLEEGQKSLENRIIRLEEGQKSLGNRIIRLEEGQKSLENRIIRLEEGQKFILTRLDESQKFLEKRIVEVQNSLQRQINDLKTFILWGFGILFGGMGLLMGFVIWDRRTALAPAIRKNKELEERAEKFEKALKELAKKDPNIAEALKHAGIL